MPLAGMLLALLPRAVCKVRLQVASQTIVHEGGSAATTAISSSTAITLTITRTITSTSTGAGHKLYN
jgi:hypothetical protein